jgi:hypothetical protein
MSTNVEAAVRWYRKRSPNATVERCVEAYSESLVRSREAKRRRRQPCRQCESLVSYDRPGGLCRACYEETIAAQHGTRSKYNGGCRCDDCREANRVSHAEWELRVRGNPPEHGTENAYRNYGCRCQECRVVGSIANHYNYERRRRQSA